MSKLEQFILITLGFFTFEILFIRINFFFGTTINKYTFIISFIMFCSAITYLYSSGYLYFQEKFKKYLPILLFIISGFFMYGGSLLLANTYDTSWDGQGYHQSAVIALANNWNPVWQPSIQFSQYLPSQIFSEGYPSALYEIQASMYAATNRINSAKIMNFIFALIAGLISFCLLRKLRFNTFLAIILSVSVIFQPIFIIQALTFMEDGVDYEILIIATAALAIIALFPKSYWAIAVFIIAELLLVTTKYSNLPIALAIGIIFLLIIGNYFLNKEYLFDKKTKLIIIGIIVASSLFSYLPYVRNELFHKAIFYPTNQTELMGSIKYNDIPNNLQTSNNLMLLFYGIFSKSQSVMSGDPRSKTNIAELKIPFTFTWDELNGSASLYNNRAGSGGVLYSGIILLAFLLLFYLYIKADTKKERYAIYSSFFGAILILLLSLSVPAPNLMRYVNQLQLLPFAIIIPLYTVFKKIYVKIFCYIIIIFIGINLLLYSAVVIDKNIYDTNQENIQFQNMRNSGKEYAIGSQQFYSSYIILKEQHIPYLAVPYLICPHMQALYASSNTTYYCQQL